MTKDTPEYLIQWKCSLFSDLSLKELYTILVARQAVFIVEQNCPFMDADGLDEKSVHLMGFLNKELVAYARIVKPGARFKEPSIGRVITSLNVRGRGLGKALMQHAIDQTEKIYGNCSIRISAQLYLEVFYGRFGFERVSEPYDEDGILHIDMLRKTRNNL